MTDNYSVIVLGVGNILMRDDGIGVWVVRNLKRNYRIPRHVGVVEGGVAGLHLLPYFEKAENLLIVDAMKGKGSPGSIYRKKWEYASGGGVVPRTVSMSAHDFSVLDLLSVADFIGDTPRVRILGVEPYETENMGLNISDPLREVFPDLIQAVLDELRLMEVVMKPRKSSKEAYSFSLYETEDSDA